MFKYYDMKVIPNILKRFKIHKIIITSLTHQNIMEMIIDYCNENNHEYISLNPDINNISKDSLLNKLQNLKSYDALFIDDDPNWFTVYNELNLAKQNNEEFPLVFICNNIFPYKNRDAYINPENIPSNFRQEYLDKLPMPIENEIIYIPDEYYHAINDNNSKNGVSRAIKDFLEENSDIGLMDIKITNEITILYPKNNISKIRIDLLNEELHEKQYNLNKFNDKIMENTLLTKYIINTINNYKDEIENNNTKINYNTSIINRINAELNLKDSQLMNLKSKLNNRENELNIAKKKMQTLNTVNLTLNTQIDTLNDNINKIKTESNTLESMLNTANSQITHKTKQINEKNAIIEKNTHQINEKNAIIEKNTHQINEKNAIIEKNTHQINEKNAIIEKNTHQINEKNQKLKNKELELNKKYLELNKKESDFDSLKQQYTHQLAKLDNKEYCIECYKKELDNNKFEINYLKKNNLTKKILNPIAYLYLLFKSKPHEIQINYKLYKALKNSNCFDIGFYLNNNQDLQESKWCQYFPLELHYVCNGFNEKREFNKKYFSKKSKKELLNYIKKYQINNEEK